MSITQKHLDESMIDGGILARKWLECADGFQVSIQASRFHYCSPRDDSGTYDAVELGFPSSRPTDEVMEYAENPNEPTDTVYAFVPVYMVDKLIELHGGIKNE